MTDKAIRSENNPTPFIAVREIEFDPDRHIFPVADYEIPAHSIVALMYPTLGEPEKVQHLDWVDDFWLINRLGEVRHRVKAGASCLVYASRQDAETGAGDLFYVQLKPGLYVIKP